MNSVELSFIFFVLVPQAVWFGCCDNYPFSLCWMTKGDVLERQNANIWLNETALKLIRKEGKVTSLTMSRGVEHKLSLQYGGSLQTWTLTIDPNTTRTKVRGLQKPQIQSIYENKDFQGLMSPTEAFACENNTVFFHLDENFFLAFGFTLRLPVKFESRMPSALQLSWELNGSSAISNTSLYHSHLGSYSTLSMDTTTNNHYTFMALDACSPYVACVEIADTASLICLSAITDPEIPQNFRMTSWNSSSISLAWASPGNHKYSLFLLTTFYLDGTDHIIKKVPFWHNEDNFVFTLSDLQPCSRVKFGLQTVCQEGMDSRQSNMVMNAGNSLHSIVEKLCQTSYGPDNYTLSWDVKDKSSITMFRVYNEGVLQGTTLNTNYTVGGLQPCQPYQAKVEALCGDGVVINVKTATAHTGLEGVSDLRYRSNDSTALWMSSLPYNPAVIFAYELFEENGTTIQSSSVTDTELHLPELEQSKSYVLDVWEQCDGLWKSQHSRLCFQGNNLSLAQFIEAIRLDLDQAVQLGISDIALTMVVPWSLPDDLQDDTSEQKTIIERIFKEELENLMKDFDPPIRIELARVEPAEKPGKTEIVFVSFDASNTDGMPLPVEDQLDYLRSLDRSDITVKDRIIYWEGRDICVLAKDTLCPQNSQCVDTLGSYTCVCKPGYYDVSSFVESPVEIYPICNENGLFSHCLDKLVTGGIAKSYLQSHMGGKIDVKLNDGRCTVSEHGMFYYFRASRRASDCGTERRVNKTHIEFKNTMTVALNKEEVISRRDLKIVWKCVYPRHYARNTQVSVGMKWLSTLSMVQFSSSLQLGLTMTLYTDVSYNDTYKSAIELGNEDFLFFQVALQTNNTFASDVLLQVESCWATETTDPEDPVQAVLLQDGCPVDETFHWHSVNGLAQTSRFSVQMFAMPQRLPLYIHCLANICGPKEDCVKNCQNSPQRSKRSVGQSKRRRKRSAVVSAGPVVVNTRGVTPSSWAEHMTMISTVAGSIGFLGLTVLLVSTTKAIMTYYEHLRLKEND